MKLLRPGAVVLYILFLMLPIYWLVIMSFKTTNEILGGFSPWPQVWTTASYRTIFTDPTWYMGYVNSITYVTLNTVISVTAALPAAYAFSRYRFVGDKHLFFWLFTNRMAPGRRLRAALPPALLRHRPLRHLHRRRARPLPLQHPARGLDPRGLHVRRAQGARRDRLRRRLLLPPLLLRDLPAQHQGRHRRRRLLLLHVLLGRDAALQDPDLGPRQAHRRRDDPHRLHLRLRARPPRRRRRRSPSSPAPS